MKPTDLCYAAGYLDGEGCFRFVGGSVNVRIESTYVHTLVWFSEMFGGSVKPKRFSLPRPSRWRQAYVWEVWGDNARDLVRRVLPYLQEKTAQASILLEIHKYPPRSERRKQMVRELASLKRINYQWNHLNISPQRSS